MNTGEIENGGLDLLEGKLLHFNSRNEGFVSKNVPFSTIRKKSHFHLIIYSFDICMKVDLIDLQLSIKMVSEKRLYS